MRRAFIHPFLFAINPVLFLYSYNIRDTFLTQIVIPLFILSIITIILLLSLHRLFGSDEKAGLTVSLFYILFFSYGHIFESIRKIKEIRDLDLSILYAEILIFGVILFFIIRSRKSLHTATGFMNVVSSAMIAASLLNIAVFMIREPATSGTAGELTEESPGSADALNKETLPNIYHIILDAYGREDILDTVYGYDNREFIDYLRGKGFFVASKSRANYSQTGLSLLSTLNMTYLDDLTRKFGVESTDRRPLKDLIRRNTLFRLLKSAGYNIYAFSSGYRFTEFPDADVYKNPVYLKEFDNLLFNTTPLLPLATRLHEFHNPYSLHRKRILTTLDNLAHMPELNAPTFVFAHIISPHPPFVFDAAGEAVDPPWAFSLADGTDYFKQPGTTHEKYYADYGRQLTFLNSRMKDVIDGILSNRERPTVIILQSDHGPRSLLDWENPKKTSYAETLSILNAYYFPDGDYGELYEDVSPVNTYRVILNKYMDGNNELLGDRSYFSTWHSPYRFIEHTGNSY